MIPVTSPSRSKKPRGYGLALATGIVIVVLVGAGVFLAVAFSQKTDAVAAPASSPSKSAAPATSPTPLPLATNAAVPVAPATVSPKIDPAYGSPVAQTVDKGAAASFADSVSAKITSLESITATGTQVGETSGPAVRLTIAITNGSSAGIDLTGINVNAYYGTKQNPASPITSSSGATRFTGTLTGGKTASATFVFSVPAAQQSSLAVSVDRAGVTSIVVFN